MTPCASTVATLFERLTNVVAPAAGPDSVGEYVVPMSTICTFSAEEPNPADTATVIGADPLMPSLVATMLAVPTPTAKTIPCGVTVATDVLSDVTIVDLETTFPFASLGTAVA